MKEFIDKLISRLEEESDFFGGEPMGSLQKAYYCKGVEKSITIVNKFAEEYKGECCEWTQKNIGGIELIREPHRMYLYKTSDDEWEYCPYCGKKIKVAPYTEGE